MRCLAIYLRHGLFFCMLLLAFSQARAQNTSSMRTPKQWPTTTSKKGDRCIVCDTPLTDSSIVILYKGRRVPLLNKAMLDQFLQNPEAYFSKLQPTGALFHEDAISTGGMKWGWFVLGLYILSALVIAAVTSNLAIRKGYSATHWYFAGLFLHVVGLLLVMRKPAVEQVHLPPHLGKVPRTAAPVPCPK
ncbi:MAG: hypothetical protein D6814_03265, partial [Calditrichaeota bacterium]